MEPAVKRVGLVAIAICAVAPFLVVAIVGLALTVGSAALFPEPGGRLLEVEGVDPAVVAMVSRTTDATLASIPGCDADPLLVLAHMSIEWPPGLQAEGRDGTRMAQNGDFYPIIQAYAPVPGADRDGGRFDGSPTAEYAAGPLQQINAFRDSYPRDGNGDELIDQNNLVDATAVEITHACASVREPGLSLQTGEGRSFEAGHYMLPSAPLSKATADYRRLVTAAYDDLAKRASWAPANLAVGGAPRMAGRHAFPVDPSLVPDEARLRAPHHDYPALDLPIPADSTVFAAAGGRVVASNFTKDCGWGVTIDADDGGEYTYCHGIRTLVDAGATVAAGEPVLMSGSTGASTGPHLHLQIRYRGQFVCPQQLVMRWFRAEDADPIEAPTSGCVR